MNKNYDRFEEIKKGDAVAVEGMPGCPCSGGAAYNITEEVTEVTKERILTHEAAYCRKTGKALSPPLAYEIAWWTAANQK